MAKDTFILTTDLKEKTESLSNEELGKVIRKIFNYVRGEPLQKLEKHLEIVFSFIKVDLDKNAKKYQDRCEKNRQAIQHRWKNSNEYERIRSNTNNTDNDNDNDNESSKEDKKEIKTKKKFLKPTLEEVKNYCLERKNKVDAERFIDYYEANGWKVGKNSMKDWKAAIRTWEKNDGSFSNKKSVSAKEEQLPDWFDKNLENEEMTQQDSKELDDILNSIHENINKSS